MADDFMKKIRHGDISFPIFLVMFAILLVIMIIISLFSSITVVRTTADIESIAQGDTVLFAMLESGICAPVSNIPLKYVLGVGLTGDPVHTYNVDVYSDGKKDTVKIDKCVRDFLKSINASKYNFHVQYNGVEYYRVPSVGYDKDKPKKTEKIYVSVPDSASHVAEVVLDTNLPERGNEACPEKEETHFCTPRTYCLLGKGTCDDKYMCAGASCCCAK